MFVYNTNLATLAQRLFSAVLLLAIAGPLFAGAHYYTPQTPEQIIGALPSWIRDYPTRVKSPSASGPSTIETTAREIQTLIDTSQTDSDSRALGLARAKLEPWWNDPMPPMQILLLRAKYKQRVHQFDEALTDLQKLIRTYADSQSDITPAWIMRVNIQLLRGNYAAVEEGCTELGRLKAFDDNLICRARMMTMTGDAEKALKLYEILLSRNTLPAYQQWINTAAAEVAWFIGDIEKAERYFLSAVNSAQRDPYVLRQFADFLLAQNRFLAVLKLLVKQQHDRGLLLRLVIAAKALNAPEWESWQSVLLAEYQLSNQLGETIHLAEQAIFTWKIQENPTLALQLAEDNWRDQKDLSDLRLLGSLLDITGSQSGDKPLREWRKSTRPIAVGNTLENERSL